MSWDEIIILAESTIHRALAMADQLRRLPPEVLLSITGYCSLVALLALLLWGSAGQRRRVTARALARLQEEMAELRGKYDAEVKWRMETERYEAREPEHAGPLAGGTAVSGAEQSQVAFPPSVVWRAPAAPASPEKPPAKDNGFGSPKGT